MNSEKKKKKWRWSIKSLAQISKYRGGGKVRKKKMWGQTKKNVNLYDIANVSLRLLKNAARRTPQKAKVLCKELLYSFLFRALLQKIVSLLITIQWVIKNWYNVDRSTWQKRIKREKKKREFIDKTGVREYLKRHQKSIQQYAFFSTSSEHQNSFIIC